MKFVSLMLILSSIFISSNAATTLISVDSTKRTSYAVGVDIGKNIGSIPVAFDMPMLLKGVEDALTKKMFLYTDEEMKVSVEGLQKALQSAAAKATSGLAEKNKTEGAAYLKENGKKAGVKTTASGLQYKVITMGKGKKPAATDKVKVHYKGTLIDGKTFDSSYDRGEPISFGLDGVIKGWTEGLQLMPVGSTFQFVIPSELAYGDNPRQGGPIGPGAVLVFDVELLGIE
ncbi:MAG: FKBP-type peptidyl-prolyl cis-trans isomerase [Fibrobacteres bacterium]|nr:FKBP-type peptidyl-prolyl cis-trans isomerase [Fibrobacterota bacterium]